MMKAIYKMTDNDRSLRLVSTALLTLLVMFHGANASAESNPLSALSLLQWSHATYLRGQDTAEADYLLGLGPMRKIRGQWAPRDSLRLRGRLQRATWLIQSGYAAAEGMAWMEERIRQQMDYDVKELFRCERLNCGSSAEWANTIFAERELYGPDRNQVYAAFELSNDDQVHHIVFYAIQRSNRRQYLHVDVLTRSLADVEDKTDP